MNNTILNSIFFWSHIFKDLDLPLFAFLSFLPPLAQISLRCHCKQLSMSLTLLSVFVSVTSCDWQYLAMFLTSFILFVFLQFNEIHVKTLFLPLPLPLPLPLYFSVSGFMCLSLSLCICLYLDLCLFCFSLLSWLSFGQSCFRIIKKGKICSLQEYSCGYLDDDISDALSNSHFEDQWYFL